MNARAILFTIIGCIVAAFYGLDSFLLYQSNGVSGPLLAKLVICGLGVCVCVRNMGRIKNRKPIDSTDQAT